MEKQKEKILMVYPYTYPKIGGVEKFVYELSKQLLLTDKYSVAVATANTETNEYFVSDLHGIAVHHIPTKFKISNTPFGFSTYFWMKKVIKIVNPDIIHAHAPVPYFAEMAALSAKRTPFVMSYHAGSLHKGIWYVDVILWLHQKFVLPLLFKRANAITTVSELTRDEMFSETSYQNKVSIVPPGVHTTIEKANLDNLTKTVTYVGRIDKSSQWKGLDVLFKAFANITKEKKLTARLQIVGDGDALDSFKKMAIDLGISEIVDFKGVLQNKDLEQAYLTSDVLVLPSVSSAESFGMVLLEAMSYGIPVIGSKIGGIANLITDKQTGLLCEAGSVSDLASAMNEMLTNDNLRARCVENGLAAVKAYTWEIQTKKFILIYDQLLMSNKKIVHVVPAYPPSLGGMEQRVFELVNKLHNQNIPVEVFTSNLNTDLGDAVENGISVHRLRKLSFLQTPISFTLFFKLLFVKADIFHVHLAQPFFPVVASFVAVLRRKPYIIHIRAIVESSNFFGKIFIYLYKNIALRFVFKFASKVIVLTDSYTELLTTMYHIPNERIFVIPNATDFAAISQPKSLFDNTTVNLIAVGRVDHQKNYHFMFRVLAALKKVDLNFTLSVVGIGGQEEELRQYAKELGVEDMIIWKGRLHGSDLQSAYENADIFIHTALFEGFGTVLIEAMAKGLPICASRVIGVKDVVKNGYNGFLCDFDEQEFAANILKISTDKILYSEISKNNLQTVKQYKWENILRDTINVYNGI